MRAENGKLMSLSKFWPMRLQIAYNGSTIESTDSTLFLSCAKLL